MRGRIIIGRWMAALSVSMCCLAFAQFEEMASPPSPADQQLFTGDQLYQRRNQTAWLAAYVAGVVDAEEQLGAGRDHGMCLPSTGNLRQYTEIFVGYLSANPERRRQPASMLVHESLTAAFHCAHSRETR